MATLLAKSCGWRIEEKVLGRRLGLVKYQLNRCLESVEEMTEVINAAVHSEGFHVKELISIDDGFAYFLLEVIMVPLRDKR